MKLVFLSYTYRPHPDHAAEIDLLQRTTRRVVEALDLRVVDGMDLGGRPLDAEIDRRIDEADALIALVTPQADAAGGIVLPEFVSTEFQRARARDKPRLRVLHKDLIARGLGAAEEHAPFDPDRMLEVVMKLLGTIAFWKKEYGRSVQIRIQPDDLATRFDVNRPDRCEYELMIQSGKALPRQQTTLWREPGGPLIHVPNFVDGARVSVRLTVDGERWQSPFVAPQLAGIELTKS
jgi:hypothetical protein